MQAVDETKKSRPAKSRTAFQIKVFACVLFYKDAQLFGAVLELQLQGVDT